MGPSPARSQAGAGDVQALDLTEDERLDLQQGAPAALERFYDLYFDRVYSYVRRLVREEHLAEDVTQDVFLHVQRSLATYDPTRPLRPWVFTIATNKVRDHWRSRRHRDGLLEVSAQDEDGEWAATPAVSSQPGPVQRAEAGELARQVEAAVAELSEGMRTVFVLRYYQGLGFDEIGDEVDRSEVAVRKRYSRALEELRERLGSVLGEQRTDTVPGAAPEVAKEEG